MSGRSVITPRELEEAVSAAISDQGSQTVADFAQLADLERDPRSVAQLIQRRLLAGRTPGRADTYTWPKDDGSSRLMTYLDPLDAILYRALVGRFVRQMEARLRRPHVVAGQAMRKRPFWRLERHTRAVRRRAAMAHAWLDEQDVLAMVTMDVKDFFYEVKPTPLTLSLSRTPGPGVTKAYLVGWLAEVERVSGATGLPVGFDASRVLANHLLSRADDALAEVDRWLRFWDDSWVFLDDSFEPEAIATHYSDAVGRDRLALNLSKLHIFDKDEAREVVQSSVIDYLTFEDETGKSRLDPDEARTLFDIGCSDPSLYKRELRRGLTVLTKDDLLGCELIEAYRSEPSLLQTAPDHWGRYFDALARTKDGRKQLDLEWVAEAVLDPKSGQPDAERLIMLPALATGQPSKSVGRQLYKLSLDSDISTAIRERALTAWGRAKGWTRDAAVELALGAGDYPTRRAALATLRGKSGDALRVERAIRAVEEADSELAPTCDWIRSAQ